MTPDAKPLLQFLDSHFPALRFDNTYRSIGELSQRFVELAGDEWAPIGKTSGESQWLPPGFIPYSITLTDREGVPRTVTISGWSHDAVWHLPSHSQIKLISNSAAKSDPDPAIWGVGNIACYLIDPVNYRWHNPPVPRISRPSLPSPNPALPDNHPSQPVTRGILAKELAFAFLKKLNAFYAAPEGLQRVFNAADGSVVVSGIISVVRAGQFDTPTILSAYMEAI